MDHGPLRFLPPPPFAPWAALLLAAASALALGLALLSQYGFGLLPCVLCVWQRWPHAAAVLLGAAAWGLRGRPMAATVLLGLAVAAELTTGGIAAFHVGVEQGWWQGTAGCGAVGGADDLASLRALVMAQPVVRCDEVAFAVLGISMAGWNAVLGAGLAALGIGAIVKDATRGEEASS